MNRWQLLEGLDPADSRTILAAATTRRLPPHVNIYEQSQLTSSVFSLSTGRARYFTITPDGRKVLLHWLVPGDTLGLAAMLQRPTHYRVSAETVRESSVLVWSRERMQSLIEEYLLSRRTGHLEERMGSVCPPPAPSPTAPSGGR